MPFSRGRRAVLRHPPSLARLPPAPRRLRGQPRRPGDVCWFAVAVYSVAACVGWERAAGPWLLSCAGAWVAGGGLCGPAGRLLCCAGWVWSRVAGSCPLGGPQTHVQNSREVGRSWMRLALQTELTVVLPTGLGVFSWLFFFSTSIVWVVSGSCAGLWPCGGWGRWEVTGPVVSCSF